MKITLSVVLSNFVKIIHIQLHNIMSYLSNKRRVVAVLEVFRQNLFRKSILIEHNKSNTILGPSHNILIL